MAMLADIEASSADEVLSKISAVLQKYGAYPWPEPPWWDKYKAAKGNLLLPDRNADWYKDHVEWFKGAQQKSKDGVVRFALRFRAD